MKLNDPFPISVFAKPVRDSIQAEFQGRCPSLREVLSLHDAYGLMLSRDRTDDGFQAASHHAGPDQNDRYAPAGKWKDPELLSQDDRLRSEVSRIRHKEGLIESELRLRGIRPQ